MRIEIMLEKEKHFILSLASRGKGFVSFMSSFSFCVLSFSFSPSIALYLESCRGGGVHINHIIKLCVGSFVFLTWSKLLLVDGDALV
jgi:hypothetical protein